MQPLTFITLNRNPESLSEIREALGNSTRTSLLTECDDASKIIADILRLRPSAALITLVPDNSENDFALIRKIVAASPDTAVITAARDASPGLVLGSLRAGAREFLQLPIGADEFRTVLDRTAEFCAALENAKKKMGRVVAVFSSKGGAGVSFFATNLAAAMPVETLLVDLNLQAGDAASFLGLDARYSFADLARNRARLDDSLITSLISPHSGHLSLLAAPFEAEEAEDIKPQDVTEVLHLLGQRYECIVLDLQHTFDPVTIAALDRADDILLVLTLDIPGIRSTKRALKVFDRVGYPRQKIHVVVNRWSKNIDVELHKVEAHLGEQLIGFVPNDYKKVMDSINLGRPLVQSDPGSRTTAEIRRIAELVTRGNHHTVAPQPLKKSLRGRFGRHHQTASLELSANPETA